MQFRLPSESVIIHATRCGERYRIRQQESHLISSVVHRYSLYIDTIAPEHLAVAHTMPRTQITLLQRKELRNYALNTRPKPTQHAVCKWFEAKYGLKIIQSTVSVSLQPKYAYLDTAELDTNSSRSRDRAPAWPELELCLAAFVQSRESHISNDLIELQARRFFARLYPTTVAPSFSPGWIQKFKERHGFKKEKREKREKSAPDPVKVYAQQEMEQIRAEMRQQYLP